MNRWSTLRRGAALVMVGGAFGLTAACEAVDDLLRVENPERIQERDLDDPKLADILVASAIGQFQDAYSNPFIWTGSLPTDEQVTGINWENYARANMRTIRYDDGPPELMFSELSEARMMADTVSGRLRSLLDSPDSDPRLATALAYAGYSYILLGDAMCEATINVGETLHQPDALYQMAVTRLEEALAIARTAGREDIANLARVGLARAHLNLGNDAETMRYAADVPEDFVWWVEYSDADPATYNVLYSRTHGGNHSLGVHPGFFIYGEFGEQDVFDQTDPRIQHTPQWSYGHNALTQLYKPFQPLLFSGFTGSTVAEICDGVADCDEDHILATGALRLPEQGTDVAMASGIEARHHYYEAAGPNGVGPAGTTTDFVNERRAFGNQGLLLSIGGDVMAELREQRARDLYLAGFRLGDLRRWKRQGVGDFFPSGSHANERWGAYADATCFPLPLEEYEGNPNIKKPGS